MSKSVIIALIIGLVVGFGAGFWSGKSTPSDESNLGVGSSGAPEVLPTESLTGTVKRVMDKSVIVEVDSAFPPTEREILVGEKTMITRNEKPALLQDLRTGDLVFFSAGENIAEKQKFEAESIYVKVNAR